MQYVAQVGDSPTLISQKFGVSRDSLLAANPHKPTTIVAGQLTWQSLAPNEMVNVPVGGMVGAVPVADPSAPHATIRQGSSGSDVALWQTIVGVTVDGKFGPNTAAATKTWQSGHGLTADGVVGPKTWAAALGSAAKPPPAPAPSSQQQSVLGAAVRDTAAAAVSALNRAGSTYCAPGAMVGTTVGNAVHNFKAAWNAANPSRPVPIGTGKYEPITAAALSESFGGRAVPPGCGATATPPPPTPVTPTPSTVPLAVQALLSINPCDQGSAATVAAAQRALGLGPDGKYGAGTAAAARKVLPNAPAGCSPRPAWWTAPGKTNVPGGGGGGAPPGGGGDAPPGGGGGAPPGGGGGAPPGGGGGAPPGGGGGAPPGGGGGAPPGGGGGAPPGGGGAAPPGGGGGAPPGGGGGGAPPGGGGAAPPGGGGGGGMTLPEKKEGISAGAIAAGALGAAALVGLVAYAATSKKTGHRGARGARGPAKRKSTKRKPAKRSKRK